MEKHHLLNEFPEHADKIHELKTTDHHFRKLFDDYHEVNKSIHRIESGAENTADEYLNNLRIQRLQLKDNLYEYLK